MGLFSSAFAGFLLLIDPLGASPIFYSITKDCSAVAQTILAAKATTVATLLLLLFIICGSSLFDYLGILPAVFKVAGGILLFSFAAELINSNSSKAEKDIEDSEAIVAAPAPVRRSPSMEGFLASACSRKPPSSPSPTNGPLSSVTEPVSISLAAGLAMVQQHAPLPPGNVGNLGPGIVPLGPS